MSYAGPERRKYPRINARFIVSYRILEESDNLAIAQTKNLSMGGMLFTTNKQFDSGAKLVLEIRLPFDPDPIMIVGHVLESREVSKDLIYDTRLQFLAIDKKHQKVVNETIDYYLRMSSEDTAIEKK